MGLIYTDYLRYRRPEEWTNPYYTEIDGWHEDVDYRTFTGWYDIETFTRQTDNSFTVADNAVHQAIFIEGRPIRYRQTAGTWRYGVATAYAAGLITLNGAPMTVADDDELQFGNLDKVVQKDFHILTTFADAAETDLLRDDAGIYYKWVKSEAYLVYFALRVITQDTGPNQPRVNVTVGGNAISTSNGNAGIEISTAWQETGVDINTTSYITNRNEDFEIIVDNNGSVKDAQDLTVTCTLVML